METQDHKIASNSGHGGSHICSKCGWPYPKLHPSAKHRRAHRKVCGTVEGYKLDNTQDEKAYLDGDVEQSVSHNDEHKTPNEKAAERNISRRSNSGVGSISINSTRSEDDVYTDTVTDFVHGSGLDASYGIVGRQKSLQKITIDPDSSKFATENANNDNSFAPVAHVENNQLQTVQKLEAENDKAEGAVLSQDCTSCSTNDSTSVSATVTIENKSAVEHIMQGSRTSSEINLNLYVGEGEETSCKDLSVVAANISDGVSSLRDVSEQLLDSVSGDRIVKPAEMDTDTFKGMVEYSFEVDSDVNDSAQVTDSVNGNIGKYACTIEEPDSKVSIEDMRVVAIPHAVPLEEHPEIAVEDLYHKEEKFTMPMAPNSTLAFEHITNRIDLGLEESCTELAKTSENGSVSSQGDVFDGAHSTENVLKQDVEQNQCEVNQNIVGDTNLLSDPMASDMQACDTNIGEFKGKLLKDIEEESLKNEVSSSEDQQKRSVPLDDGSVEAVGIILDGGDDQSAILEEENLIVLEINSSPAQVKEVINARDSNDIGDGEKMIGEGNESKARTTETEPCYELSLPGSHEENVEVSKIDNCESRKILDISNVIVGVSQPESLRAPEGVGETQNTGDHIMKSEVHLDSPSKVTQSDTLIMHEDIGCSLSSSALLGHNSSDSLDGNWGSVSALSETKQHQSPALQTEANNQKEDKRNKEIIAKVTNWGSGKKRTPLKALLGEDTERSGAESDESIPVTKNEVTVKKESDILGTEIEKEWKSPGKYPVNIKTEKRKTKYWASFLCCHSPVNADR